MIYSVKTKICAAMVGLSILLSVSASFLSTHYSRLLMERKLFNHAQSTAYAIQLVAETASTLPELQMFLEALTEQDEIDRIDAINSADNLILASSHKERVQQSANTLLSAQLEVTHMPTDRVTWQKLSESLFLLTEPSSWNTGLNTAHNGLLAIVFDETEALARLKLFSTHQLMITLAISTLLTLVTLVLLWQLVLRHVKSITEVVNKQYQTDAQSRCQVTTHDEFGELSDSLNHMLDMNQRAKQMTETARDEAEKLAEARITLLAKISHELRTPLTAIIGFCDQAKQTLQHHPENRLKALEALGTVESNALFLLEIINDLLDASKLEENRLTLAKQHFDLVALAQEIVTTLEPLILADPINVKFTCPAQHLLVAGDPVRIKQILMNLLSNAIKFTEQGQVELCLKRIEQAVIIQVIDSGEGIADTDLITLFNAFSQAHSSMTAKFGGTGLGLFICKKLTDLMSGTLTVESQVGQGSTFTLKLPLPAIAQEDYCPVLREEVPPELNLKEIGGHVIIADDMPDILSLYRALLAETSTTVTTFMSGDELLASVAELSFDLIILDMQMPGSNGIETLHALRAKGFKQPALIATASLMPDEKTRYLHAGFVACLAKPLHKNEFYHLLHQYLPQINGTAMEQIATQKESDFARKMALIKQEYLQDLPQELAQIELALEAQNFAAIKQHAHAIKGSAGSLGYPSLSGLAKSLEAAATSNATDEAQKFFTELNREYEQLIRTKL